MSDMLSMDNSPHATDEQWNTASHTAAAVFSIFGAGLLIAMAGVQGKPWHVVSFSIYGATLFLLFLFSSLHHGVRAGGMTREVLRTLDYVAIFLLIAGSMTPMCLVLLRGVFGWTLFGVIWAVAAAGLTLRSIWRNIPKYWTNTLYVAAGWLALTAVLPIYRMTGWGGIGLLFAGAVFYTAGSALFLTEKPNPIPGKLGFHEIWHFMVIGGAFCHFLFMYFFVLPAP